MGLIIIFLFFFVALCALLEDYLGKYKWFIYVGVGIILVLVAGLKEIGIDPDSENYEGSFLNYYNADEGIGVVEWSYTFISSILNLFTQDVHSIFLIYAALGIGIKMLAFKWCGDRVLLTLLVYISYYYVLHDCMQIRAGVMSAFFLLAIRPLAEGKRKKALLAILCGSFFHYSGFSLIPLVFLNNKKCDKKSRIKWASLIPIGYLLYFAGFTAAMALAANIPYIGDKLMIYQTALEQGVLEVMVNVVSPQQLFIIFLYCYILIFYDTIEAQNKYFPIMMKILSIGLMFFPTLAFLPVLAQRMCHLYSIVDIFLFANIFYTIKQKWAGWLLVLMIAFIFLNYALPFISFTLFWDGK